MADDWVGVSKKDKRDNSQKVYEKEHFIILKVKFQLVFGIENVLWILQR